ncbi:hypothetical protein M885DRAFT_609732, partial [Pelagophyceae sp. CCMP2097]
RGWPVAAPQWQPVAASGTSLTFLRIATGLSGGAEPWVGSFIRTHRPPLHGCAKIRTCLRDAALDDSRRRKPPTSRPCKEFVLRRVSAE